MILKPNVIILLIKGYLQELSHSSELEKNSKMLVAKLFALTKRINFKLYVTTALKYWSGFVAVILLM